jgi:hypothetical protein
MVTPQALRSQLGRKDCIVAPPLDLDLAPQPSAMIKSTSTINGKSKTPL